MLRRMVQAAGDYLTAFAEAATAGWNHFWFAPSSPLTLSALRPLVGLLAFYYLASFTLELDSWFGRDGWLTVESVQRLTDALPASRPSLYGLASQGGVAAIMAVHLVGLVIAASFTAGLFTRLTSLGTLIFVLSAIHRNPLVTGTLEPVLVLLLIGMTIAPSGAFFSIDRWRIAPADLPKDEAHWTATLGARLMQVQISAFFFMMAISKMSASSDDIHTWWIGEGIWHLIAKGDSRLVDLTGLRDSIFLLNFWTHSIVAFELVFSLGIWQPLLRPLLIGASIVMWGSLALVTGLVPFCAVMFLTGLVFVQPETIAKLLASEEEPAPAAIA